MRRRYYDSHKCTKSLGIDGNHARLESDNKTSRTKGTHDSRAPDDLISQGCASSIYHHLQHLPLHSYYTKRLEASQYHRYTQKGSNKVAGNYTSVNLTSVLCKIFESIIRDSLHSTWASTISTVIGSSDSSLVDPRFFNCLEFWTDGERSWILGAVLMWYIAILRRISTRSPRKLSYYGIR